MLKTEALDTPSLALYWGEAPWDSAILGHPVLQITDIEIRGSDAGREFSAFETARDALDAGMVSCRLPHNRLRESMFLEDQGFRFIEMAYQPELNFLNTLDLPEGSLTVSRATETDLPPLLEIAGGAFGNERFHVDPRLPPGLGDQRYRNWVRNSLDSSNQRLEVVREGRQIVAFFVTEMLADGTLYWHLNAVSPKAQGRGYGKRAWKTMLAQAKREGANRIRTCIVARNHRVLNLYARLGFRFPPPLMTLHWLRSN